MLSLSAENSKGNQTKQTAAPPETAFALWQRSVAQFAEEPAFKRKDPDRGDWETFTYRETDDRARELAAGLRSCGVEVGDKVCIASQTRFEWVLADLALVQAGCVSVPVYATLPANQAQYIAKHSGARAVFVEDPSQLEKFLGLHDPGQPQATSAALPLWLIYTQPEATVDKAAKPEDRRAPTKLEDVLGKVEPEVRARVISMEALAERGRRWFEAHPEQADSCQVGVNAQSCPGPESPFTIVYTSGTTGTPKGVVLSNRNLAAGVLSACRALKLEQTDEQLLFLPLAHVLARQLCWAPAGFGAVTAFAEGVAQLRQNLLEVRPTFMGGVPRVFEKFHAAVAAKIAENRGLKKRLVDWSFEVGRARSRAERKGIEGSIWGVGLAERLVFSKLRARLGLDRCRFLVSGGAPLAPEIAEFFHAAGLLVLEGYGLTETMAAACVNGLDSFRFGTVGRPIDAVSVKVAADGEILFKGASVFSAYHNDPEATQAAFREDGWFQTGDIGHLEDGYLRITDRKKDLIILAGGKNVAPQPIENALKMQCPHIGQAVVVGDKRPYCSALVTLSESAVERFAGDRKRAASDPGLRSEIETAVNAVNDRGARFEGIKRFTVLGTDLTEESGDLTPSLKVKRKVVIAKFEEEIEAMYG